MKGDDGPERGSPGTRHPAQSPKQDAVLTDLITREWLTDVLRSSGVLRRGRVVAVDQRERSAFDSRVVHIRPRYSAGAPEGLPSGLVLKRMERGWGEREVAFYRRVRDGALSMVVPCYLADLDEQTGSSWLLLEDVSSTHHESVSRQSLLACDGVPPTRELDRIMTSLAHFHAYWWEHPELGRVEPLLVRAWYRDDRHFRKLVARREREWASFSAAIPDNDRELYDRALARLPTLWRRLGGRIGSTRNLTLSHGDC
jgi:hypothetical protein